LRALFELENRYPDRDVVLVRADKSDEIRLAFRNYFSDATEFIRLLEEGCTKLSGEKRVPLILKKPSQIGGSRLPKHGTEPRA